MTLVTATSYLALVSAGLVQQLADVVDFQTLVGAANATAAKGKIVEDDAGRSDDTAGTSTAVDGTTFDPTSTNWGVVMIGDEDRTERALRTTGRSGAYGITLIIRPSDPTDDPASAKRRARNLAGAIADGVQALFGATTARICGGTCVVVSCTKADAIRSLNGAYVAMLAGTWRDVP